MVNLRKQLFITLCVYLGQALVGFGMGWSAPVIPKLTDPDSTPLPTVPSSGQTSWIGSVLYIGCIIGPYISGYLSNVKGRKPCFVLAGIITVASFIMLAAAKNLATIYAGRIVLGFGIGMIAVVNLVYIGEIASTNIRGILLTGTGVFATLGNLLVYSVGPYVSYPMVSVLGLTLTLVYLVGLFFIPETPLFHVMKGNEDKAAQILHTLGRKAEMDAVLTSKPEKNANSDWKELFSERSNRMAMFIVFTLSTLQQMSGVVAVTFFATTIFDLAGSTIEPNIATIAIGVTQLGSSCIAPLFVDRSGRKILLILSTATCSVSLAVLGIYFYLDESRPDGTIAEKIGWLPMVSLVVFFLCYDLGFGIIPGTLTGEMFKPNVRSVGSAVVVTSAWTIGFGVSTAFGYMLDAWGGHVTFWIYASACALAAIFTFIFVPETKGKTLVEIQLILGK